jgi:lambda repressor-like predicted transcriptional regulator
VANEHLRQAIDDAGLEPAELAAQIEVDTKTVERWIAGRTPYPRYRSRVAHALNREPHQLWPELAAASDAAVDIDDEGLHRPAAAVIDPGDSGAPNWETIFAKGIARIDLLDLTLAHIINSKGTVEILAAKAADGCHIRILISNPESAHLTVTEAERTPGQDLIHRPALADEAQRILDLLEPLRSVRRIEVRTFVAPGYNSILRADDQLLAAVHLWGTGPAQAPLLHLRAGEHHDLFAQFTAHYDAIWSQAASKLTQT